jgi:hypothetical protein
MFPANVLAPAKPNKAHRKYLNPRTGIFLEQQKEMAPHSTVDEYKSIPLDGGKVNIIHFIPPVLQLHVD